MTTPWDEKGAEIDGLIRPLLEALAKLADLESTYLTVFDWERSEQEVRFVFSAGETQVEEGHRIPLPVEVSQESFPGVTRSPQTALHAQPDSLVARRLGLEAFVSVPVVVAKHRLVGMLCGASRNPRQVSETVVGLFESFADIMADHLQRTEMQEMEDRAAAAESKLLDRARFLVEVEHRVKTPLSALHGAALILRDRREELSEPARIELEQSVVRSVLLLSRELESLLIEARADVRARELSPVDLDMGALVHQIADAFCGLSANHDIVADVATPARVLVDADAMYQVIGHLVDNAIKYSPDGGLITIRLDEAEGSVTIDVIDEGIGLPTTGDLFEPFRRGDPDDERTAGIGLGLHIVRNLVEAMGGTVTARTNSGAGSTFSVNVPRAVGRRHPAVPVGRVDASGGPRDARPNPRNARPNPRAPDR